MNRILLLVGIVVSCQEREMLKEEFTGNQTIYPLYAGSSYPVSGVVTMREKSDGFSLVVVELTGTIGNTEHPVHLHAGSVGVADAPIEALLNPVIGTTGTSETNLVLLANEQFVTYKQLIGMNACIKVHLATSGQNRDVILAAGNIGSDTIEYSNGRSDVSVCRSSFIE